MGWGEAKERKQETKKDARKRKERGFMKEHVINEKERENGNRTFMSPFLERSE